MRRRLLVALAVATVVMGAHATAAGAVTWCGTPTDADLQPDLSGGPSVHVVYAYPSDGQNRFSSFASAIASDVDAIDRWWRREDPTRTPRFDLTSFAGCSSRFGALDLTVVQFAFTSGQMQPLDGRMERIVAGLSGAGLTMSSKKYLVYWDGPTGDARVCGQGALAPLYGGNYALSAVYMQDPACQLVFGTGGSGAFTAAHELIHNFGGVMQGAPHPCGSDWAHVCDDTRDVMRQYVGPSLFDQLLDAGRDDYYGHSGGWWDVQDSDWLRRADATVTLQLNLATGGTVDVIDRNSAFGTSCLASCTLEWDAGSLVAVTPQAADGYALRDWGGPCAVDQDCVISLEAATSFSPVFARELHLRITVKGAGKVRGPGFACAKSCERTYFEGDRVPLRVQPARGMTFLGWSGACKGKKCALRIGASDVAVTARFGRVKTKPKR